MGSSKNSCDREDFRVLDEPKGGGMVLIQVRHVTLGVKCNFSDEETPSLSLSGVQGYAEKH